MGGCNIVGSVEFALGENHGVRISVRGEGTAAQTKGFQRDGPASAEYIRDEVARPGEGRDEVCGDAALQFTDVGRDLMEGALGVCAGCAPVFGRGAE